MAKHSTDLGHHIQFQDTRILVMRTQCIEHIIGEAREIKIHPSNRNREEGFSMRKSWKLLLQTLKK
jgi:hypothetical protein